MAKFKTLNICKVGETLNGGGKTVEIMDHYEATVSFSVKPFGTVGEKSLYLPKHLAEKSEALFAEINEYLESESK